MYNIVDYGTTDEIYDTMDMGYTGIITCPFCRTKDYRLKYIPGNMSVLPEELIYDIKKLKKYWECDRM